MAVIWPLLPPGCRLAPYPPNLGIGALALLVCVFAMHVLHSGVAAFPGRLPRATLVEGSFAPLGSESAWRGRRGRAGLPAGSLLLAVFGAVGVPGRFASMA